MSGTGETKREDDRTALPIEPHLLDADPCSYCFRARDDHATECPLNPRKIGLDFETEEGVEP